VKTGQVFVSHTSDMAVFPEDRPFVQAALDAVGRARMAPTDMRYFAARDGRPADYCRQRVRESEIYVAVVGFRYGSLVSGETVSYTELEFETASDAGVPRLVFLLDDTACPPGLADGNRDPIARFRQRLRNAGMVVRAFASSDGLELEVFHALSELTNERHEAGGVVTRSFIETVPRIWNVPNRNADFTGRDGTISQLHRELTHDGKAVVLAQALYGLGGIGKTQVALEYAHRFKSDYDLIWWIPAEHPGEISSALADLAGRLGLQPSDNNPVAAAAALEQLRRDAAGRWLLIFDNAEDPEGLEPFLPSGSGHVLITSRNHAWTRHAEPIELDVFTNEESIIHLLRHVPGLDRDDAARVSAAVGSLPLAIEQAAAWLAETGMPASSYTDWLETQTTRALGLNKPPGYAMPVAATWNLSLDRLRVRSPAAVRLLQILAFCSPGPISMNLLYSNEMIEQLLPYDKTLRDKYMFSQVVGSVSRLSLVKIDQSSNSLQIHRLVQAVVRSQMTDDDQNGARHSVHYILVGARPQQGETDDPENWPTYEVIWPHLGPSQAEECDDARTRQLLVDWVRYQWKRSEFDSGLSLGRRLESLWSGKLGRDDQQTLELQFQIANILRQQGLFSESKELDTYVLDRQQAVLGSNHLHPLLTEGSLGADLRALGEFQNALALAQDTYRRLQEHFGDEFPRTLAAAHNLGCSLRMVGDYPAARVIDNETLQIQRRVHGRDHPFTLLSATSLGYDLRMAGAFQESVDLLHATWDRYRVVIGDDIVDTLCAASSLAASLRKAGARREAMDLAQATYSRYLARYGRTLPEMLSCALNLACSYAALRDHDRARELASDVLATYQASLGEDHPSTLVAASNMVTHLRDVGQLAEALHLAGQTLARMRSRLGGNHPLSLSCAINMTICLADSKELTQAEVLGRETVQKLEKKLGVQHPETLVGRANVAVTLYRTGRMKEAEQAKRQIMRGFNQVLGEGHPDTALLQGWHYISCDLESPPI
jgi:hypothetical protein